MNGETASNVTKLSTPKSNKKLRNSRKKKATFTKSRHQNISEANNNDPSVSQCQTHQQTSLLIKEYEELKQTNYEQKECISDLQKKIDKLNDILSGQHIEMVGKGSNLISNRIIELSRKNRHLCSDMEIYRTKNETLQRENTRLKTELTSKENKMKDNQEVEQNELEVLKEKIKSLTNKLFEASNQNTILKNDMKLTLKCLKKEIGENKPIFIQKLLNNGGNGWKGRAQQILSLQTKVTELTKKLEGIDDHSFRDKQKQLEFVRKCEVESFQKETQELKATVTDLQFKLTASKIRNKNIMNEICSYKLKCQSLKDNQERTEEKYSEMKSQISAIKLNYESQLNNLAKKLKISESKSQLCHTSVSQVMCEVHNKRDLLLQKDSEISTLQKELELLKHDLRQVSGGFLFNCRDLQKHQYLAILNNLEEEKNQILSQVEKLNVLLSRERESTNNFQDLLQKQRLKICRLEGSLSKFSLRLEFKNYILTEKNIK